MKKLIILAGVFLFSLLTIETASAFVEKGDKEVAVSGAFTYMRIPIPDQDFHTDNKMLMTVGSFGYFVTSSLLIGIDGSINWTSFSYGGDVPEYLEDSDYSGISGSIGGFAKYHFLLPESPRALPYIGGSIGKYLRLKKTEEEKKLRDPITLGLGCGLKYFISEDKSIFGEYKYNRMTMEILDEKSVSMGWHMLFFGLASYF